MKHIITLLPALLCGCNDNVVGDKNITLIDMEDKQVTIKTNIDYVAYNMVFFSMFIMFCTFIGEFMIDVIDDLRV